MTEQQPAPPTPRLRNPYSSSSLRSQAINQDQRNSICIVDEDGLVLQVLQAGVEMEQLPAYGGGEPNEAAPEQPEAEAKEKAAETFAEHQTTASSSAPSYTTLPEDGDAPIEMDSVAAAPVVGGVLLDFLGGASVLSVRPVTADAAHTAQVVTVERLQAFFEYASLEPLWKAWAGLKSWYASFVEALTIEDEGEGPSPRTFHSAHPSIVWFDDRGARYRAYMPPFLAC